MKEKDQRVSDLEGEVREKDQRFADLEGQMKEKDQRFADLEGEVREKDQRFADLERQVTEKDQRVADLEGQVREKDQRVADLEGQVTEKDQRVADLEGQVREKDQGIADLEGQVREKDQQVDDLQGQVTEIDQKITYLQRQVRRKDERQVGEQSANESHPDWIINRSEISLTEKVLGRGGWGTVVKGHFRRCDVAVKELHAVILSEYNRDLFEREVSMASRCRHPCFLQFIGATNDEGSPLIVTELMETSLRARLSDRHLPAAEVSNISLDVARALNYLHQKRPQPIIHRDISSANVLLWRKGDQWRGKLSDYGTANFVRQCTTVSPGSPIYSAPEIRSETLDRTVSCKVRSLFI